MSSETDIEAIASEMSEDIKDNNGLRPGLTLLPEAESHSFRYRNRALNEDMDNTVSMSPYRIPASYKSKPAVKVLHTSGNVLTAKPAPAAPVVASAPAKPPAPAETPKLHQMGDRVLEI
jgi:hypothetical protein